MGSPPEKIRDGRNALIVSVAIVLFLVGTRHIDTTSGRLGEIGDSLEKIGFFLAIPPAVLLVILSGTGMEIPASVRESLVGSDAWLWIYRILFYTLFFYFLTRSWKKIMRQ